MNNQLRTIEAIIPPPAPHMVGDGFRVHGFFPGGRIDKRRMSPFFLMDYNAAIEFAPSPHPRGVGVHPHRGFETVTIAFHGSVAHHDSAGHSGIIGEGDVQWMTAGSGVLHKEYHEAEFSRRGGLFQMVQLWVNLPSRYKMTPPKYQEIIRDKMGWFSLPAEQGRIEVIAGSYQGVKGPASTFTPLEMYTARLKKGARADFRFPGHYNTGMLVVEGIVSINDQQAATDHFVLFRNDGTDVSLIADTDSVVLILSGEPIDEPIAQYGPFLMNTWKEVEEAMEDVNRGKFGVLED